MFCRIVVTGFQIVVKNKTKDQSAKTKPAVAKSVLSELIRSSSHS